MRTTTAVRRPGRVRISSPATEQSGQGMLEYVLIVVFVAVAGIVVWRSFGGEIKNLVSESGSAVSDQSKKVLDDYKKNKNK